MDVNYYWLVGYIVSVTSSYSVVWLFFIFLQLSFFRLNRVTEKLVKDYWSEFVVATGVYL